MAPTKRNTSKVSAYSIYSRNTKKKDSYLDVKVPTQRKRKLDIAENVNGIVSEKEVIEKKKDGEKMNVQEVIPITENSYFRKKLEIEEEENEKDVNISFKLPTAANASNSRREPAVCGSECAESAFYWLLNPMKPNEFFEKAWEKKPLFIQHKSGYYNGVYSIRTFEKTVKENYLKYEQEIDVVKYVDGKRVPIIPDRKVIPAHLWDMFHKGYSIRLRNPQVYCTQLAKLCVLLQEYFSSFVGSNMYLTPPNTQGFPPHYDDIDAFILQIEGKKHWKLYTPSDKDMLARYSSPDLTEDAIGEPCLEVELNPGDLLYFPRGFIHQAKAAPDMHSLHITLSTNQLNTWRDLLTYAFDDALDRVAAKDIEFRKSIPMDYLDYMGYTYSQNKSKERKDFLKKSMSLIQKVLDDIQIDSAVDTHAIDFIHGSLPPTYTEEEKVRSIHGYNASFKNGKQILQTPLTSDKKIRIIRKRAFLLDVEENQVRLFHSMDNGKSYKEKEAAFNFVNVLNLTALTELLRAYPKYTKIKDLTSENQEILMSDLQSMYDHGFLMTEEPATTYEKSLA